LQALDPRNFKDSGDVGTLAVRYVLQPQGDKNTVLRIDAVFVEEFRRIAHASNGSVEGSEYKDIHDRLDALDVMKQQAAEAEQENQQERLRKKGQAVSGSQGMSSSQTLAAAAAPETAVAAIDAAGARDAVPAAQSPAEMSSGPTSPGQASLGQTSPEQTLEQHVQELRHQVERLVKAPGAPLKSAPFHTASVLSPLPTGTEVLILISTPYWYGVETRAGQHGWIYRDDLEPLP
jgi:polyhydroxyalkanoate synthesis regulator phasin